MKRILIAVTSCDHQGSSGESTGYDLSEVSHSYLVFRDYGYEVDFVSVQGGNPPIEKYELSDPINRAFLEDQDAQDRVRHALRPQEVVPRRYAAVFFAGGLGAMWDFPDNQVLQAITASIYEGGGVIGAVSHGLAGIVNVRLRDGRYLVAGKAVSAFTNEEEEASGTSRSVPFRLEDSLKQRGVVFRKAAPFIRHREICSRLITGQNPASAEPVARAMVELLAEQEVEPFPRAS